MKHENNSLFNYAPFVDDPNLSVHSDNRNPDIHIPVNEQHVLRGSTRVSIPPNWHNDFLISSNSSTTHPLAKFFSYNHLHPQRKCYVIKTLETTDSTDFTEAANEQKWILTMQEEIDALEKNKTWEIITLPPEKIAIGRKWIYKTKFHSDGTIDKHKFGHVAKGYNQQQSINYSDTFSPVAKMVTVRSALVLAAIHDRELDQMDVVTAFLQGDLHE